MARTARKTRTTRNTGINAAAWFYSQSFHSSTETQPRLEGVGPARVLAMPTFDAPFTLTATTASAPVVEPADLFAGLEAIDPRELLMDALEDERIIADRDLELDYRAAREGDACGRSCGFCGRCS